LKTEDHRKLVEQHLMYIKERVDDNAAKLDRINGRVRKNESSIAFIKGFGTLTIAIITAVLGWFKYE
tara:strand:- start:2100 stop:2300 length:201 start_codon:yes stop_codon:yes gene_type:complete